MCLQWYAGCICVCVQYMNRISGKDVYDRIRSKRQFHEVILWAKGRKTISECILTVLEHANHQCCRMGRWSIRISSCCSNPPEYCLHFEYTLLGWNQAVPWLCAIDCGLPIVPKITQLHHPDITERGLFAWLHTYNQGSIGCWWFVAFASLLSWHISKPLFRSLLWNSGRTSAKGWDGKEE